MMTAINLMRTGTKQTTKKGHSKNKYSTEFKLKVLADVANRGEGTKKSVAHKYGIPACVISYFEKEKGNDKTYTQRLKHKREAFELLIKDGVKRKNSEIAITIGVSATTAGRWVSESK